MSDLIERLRQPIRYELPSGAPMILVHGYLKEAADEIERLTKENEELRAGPVPTIEWEELKRENEELRDAVGNNWDAVQPIENWLIENDLLIVSEEGEGASAGRNILNSVIAALKAQSAEPVGVVHEVYVAPNSDGKSRAIVLSDERLSQGAELYVTPPTATALVEAFKRRAVEVCDNRLESSLSFGVLDVKDAIEALPLIEGEK